MTVLDAETERAVVAVVLRYARGIDQRDWVAFESCFAENFEGDYPSFGQWRSAGEITQFMRQAHQEMGHTLHRLTNIDVRWMGDRLTARTYVDAVLTLKTPQQSIHRAIGFYDDEFVRQDEQWKISKRRFTAVSMGPL